MAARRSAKRTNRPSSSLLEKMPWTSTTVDAPGRAIFLLDGMTVPSHAMISSTILTTTIQRDGEHQQREMPGVSGVGG